MTNLSGPTIYDVASAAEVSISTVSNALNRPERVSAQTRERVLAIADQLGYVPKTQAIDLARKGMRRIAVLAPFSTYPSFYERLSGVLEEATAAGVEVSVFDHESAATATTPLLASMPIRGQVDGIVVMGQAMESPVEARMHQRGLPAVVVDADSALFSTVTCDDYEGGRLAAEYLLAAGHERLCYAVERQVAAYESQAVLRLRGFQDCVRAAGADVTVVETVPDVDAVAASVAPVLVAMKPTAVMAHYDAMAVGVLRAARDLQLSVPLELAVMGYDDGPIASATELTTIRQPFRESGRAATRLLLDDVHRPGQGRRQVRLGLQVVERTSTRSTRPALTS